LSFLDEKVHLEQLHLSRFLNNGWLANETDDCGTSLRGRTSIDDGGTQCDQIGRNLVIWAKCFGVGRNFFLKNIA
jgi:hypothetical protein